MTFSRRGLFAAAGLLAPTAPALAQDRLPPVSIRRSEVSVSRTLTVARPDLPVPGDRGMLCYVQHAINRNVLVYAARQRPDGSLDPQRPVEVFWRRFGDENGNRRELSFFERVFAFGVSTQSIDQARHSARIAGYRERDAVIDVGTDGTPRALMTVGARTIRVVYAYAEAEDRRFIPKIHHVDIHGIDIASGEAVRERVRLDM
ncbi:MAG: DUF4833 domain-containing protein [Phreatobacter sp.]|uniref:DUF4833 domain-containing protein n=1 Tax=Phreatobacter sp. TaxID=1966341 RepID=UPI0027336FCB|nr:DUF4833 domain-containing protein [Phreatobacter sp.]MDP2801980.1 DUF4833 domain-containing protein [Phreatobacter sp.]